MMMLMTMMVWYGMCFAVQQSSSVALSRFYEQHFWFHHSGLRKCYLVYFHLSSVFSIFTWFFLLCPLYLFGPNYCCLSWSKDVLLLTKVDRRASERASDRRDERRTNKRTNERTRQRACVCVWACEPAFQPPNLRYCKQQQPKLVCLCTILCVCVRVRD